MASIARRPDGRWRARYRDDAGREHPRYFPRKIDAQRWLDGVTASVVRGDYIDPKAARITLRVFAGRWLAEQSFDPSTREAVELRWRLHIAPYLGDSELRLIRPSTLRAWLSGLDGLAPSYRRVIFANLSRILSAAVDDGLIPRNPCQARTVKAPKASTASTGRVEPWPTERVQAVLAALPERYRPVGVVAAACRLRQGEVFGLRVADLDFLRRVVRVEQQVKIVGGELVTAKPKGGRTRTVPLPDVAAVALAEHLRTYPAGGLVFTSRERRPLNRNYVNSRVPCLSGSLETPAVDLHPCRARLDS